MTLIYADTSAIVRGYLDDEPADTELAGVLFAGEQPVVTSELTRVEFASAMAAAARADRLTDVKPILDQFDHDCSEDGQLSLLPFRAPVFAAARELLLIAGPLRTLDAIHIAVARDDAAELAAGDPVVLLTRDERQAAAARAAGLETR